MVLTSREVTEAVAKLGVTQGDSVLVHSSFKSLGETENGAETVISGLRNAVGKTGTVIFPTLCQKDWEHVYENWSPDAESDIGYLTNYFRKLPEAKRSNQATHSVAAIGAQATYLTETHGNTGLRYGIFGDTPFAADSPWEKMYHMNTKVLFIGVGIRKCTFRHYVEYCFMEQRLQQAEKRSDYAALKAQVWHYDKWNDGGVWPHIDSEYVEKVLEAKHQVQRVHCGNAIIMAVSAVDFVDCARELLEKRDIRVFAIDDTLWDVQQTQDWLNIIEQGGNNNESTSL